MGYNKVTMTGISYLLAFCALFIGGITAYEDFRFGKIRNKWILLGLGLGIFLLVTSFFKNDLSNDLFSKILINALVSLFLGYLFWYFDLWAAGDAKLFFVLALLLPFKFYWHNYLPIFPSLVILINTFIPLFAFIFLQSAFLIIKKLVLFFRQARAKAEFEDAARKFFQNIVINYLSYFWVALVFGLVFISFQLIRLEIGHSVNGFALGRAGIFFFIALLGMLAGRIAKNKKIVLTAAVILALYIGVAQLFYSHDLISNIAKMTGDSTLSLIGIGFLGWLFNFYEKNSQGKNLHFAFWLFLGVILTDDKNSLFQHTQKKAREVGLTSL